jgi:hypothetical protein
MGAERVIGGNYACSKQQIWLPDSPSEHVEKTPPSKHGSRELPPPRVESFHSANRLYWREK